MLKPTRESGANATQPFEPHMLYHIGTVGFSYQDWLSNFYPPRARPADFLSLYAQAFSALELDTTFHAIPSQERTQKWAAAVPSSFLFCPKTPKQITHEGALSQSILAMRQFLRALQPMRAANKLGSILIQFPPYFHAAERPALQQFLAQLPTDFRYAVEFRNVSWWANQGKPIAELLALHRCAWVAGDYALEPLPIHITTDFLYLRFIGTHEQYTVYDHERVNMSERLAWWLEQLHAAIDASPIRPTAAYAFFTDDYAGHAPSSANRLRRLLNLPTPAPAPVPDSQQSLF